MWSKTYEEIQERSRAVKAPAAAGWQKVIAILAITVRLALKRKKRSVFAASATGWGGLGNAVNRPHNAGILRGMQMSVALCQQNPEMQPVAEWASNTKVADGLWDL